MFLKFNVNKLFFIFLIYFVIIIPNGDYYAYSADETIKYNEVLVWADKISVELWHLGDFITRRKEVEESFKSAQIVPRNGQKIVNDMAMDIKYMMDAKIGAVERIMENAEQTAMSHQNDEVDILFPYYNAKEMLEPTEIPPTQRPLAFNENKPVTDTVPPKEIVLTQNPHFFDTAVNLSVSSVHIPTNVFDRSIDVIKGIQWSEKLDLIFQSNYRKDPTLSWQFFGSSTGFMRQFPAAKWKQDTVDLFDCRLRSWYINAANSPKDIVILIDNSGSMTGERQDIARHVVYNILDTLGTNDFVNIFTFSDLLDDIVPCFKENLVQANMENVRELKNGLNDFNTTEIANFTAALTKAFDILERYRSDKIGARCNQAIMLISDGVSYNYKDIFEQYNWMNSSFMPVRLFTYLIGQEVSDVKEIKWMACENRGYYVHLSTRSEVREQVFNYIAVMARPLVLHRNDHPVLWSDVYADIVDPKMTDWLWEVKECKEQKERFLSERKDKELFYSPDEQNRRLAQKLKENQEQSTYSKKYVFMTTVSMPVFDRHENATKIAKLLGVAGTDVPINEIKKLMMPFMLGVNGYAFIVTNNGYILIHPDLRPVFQEILKPAYNSVDMLEVELMDDDRGPRNFSPMLLDVRDAIVEQTNGSKWMLMKYHLDSMKRVSRVKRQYFWTPIKSTPFTLVITYPEELGVNRLKIRDEDDIHRMHVKGTYLLNFFNGHRWRIHPEWLYCKHSLNSFSTPEAELLYFLERMNAPGWRWPPSRTPLPPEHNIHSNTSSGRSSSFSDKDSYYCDRNLVQSLVMDARQTEWFSRNLSLVTKEEKGPSPIAVLMGLLPRTEFKQRFGITVVFLATHSGLTRWQEFYSNMPDNIPEQDFSENNKRAIDEIWYRRAVEQHAEDPQSFVYSVPFDTGYQNDTIVTASHAVFVSDNDKSAPAAVVGFQFQHSALYTLFKNITSSCVESPCAKTCASDDVECYVLDNNGYIIIGGLNDTGKFFGEVHGSLMHRLVEDNVFKQVEIYDYQAVCFVRKDTNNIANILKTPFIYLFESVKWICQYFFFLLIKYTDAYGSYSYVSEDLYGNYDGPEPTERYDIPISKQKEREFDKRVLINKTRPEPCDQTMTLYLLNNEKDKTIYKTPSNGCERPFVVLPIPKSNLIILVVDTLCPFADKQIILTTQATEIQYNSSLACFKSAANRTRRRPSSCINQHQNESNIELCGRGNYISFSFINLLVLFIIYLINV